MKALVNPFNHIAYSSFYIYALEKVLGKENVRFYSRPFKALSADAQLSRGLLFILQDGETEKKIFVYTGDSWKIDEEIYNWCDATFLTTRSTESSLNMARKSIGIDTERRKKVKN